MMRLFLVLQTPIGRLLYMNKLGIFIKDDKHQFSDVYGWGFQLSSSNFGSNLKLFQCSFHKSGWQPTFVCVMVAYLKLYVHRKNEYPKKVPHFYEVTNNSKERPDVWIDSPDKFVTFFLQYHRIDIICKFFI